MAGSNGAVTVTDHEQFDPTAVSVTTQLSKIKATNPQAVLVWTTGTPLGTVLSGMQQLGMTPAHHDHERQRVLGGDAEAGGRTARRSSTSPALRSW